MYRIKGTISEIDKRAQRQNKVLTEAEVIEIGCKIWKHQYNPVLLERIRRKRLQIHQTRACTKDTKIEIGDASSKQAEFVDVEIKIGDDDDALHKKIETRSFWDGVKSVIFTNNQKTEHQYVDLCEITVV